MVRARAMPSPVSAPVSSANFYCEVDCFARGGCALEAVYFTPRVERDDWAAELFRKTDFRQGAASARHRDDRIRARDDDRIACLSHPCRDDELDEFVGACAIVAGNYPNGMPAGAARAFRRRTHDAAE